MTTMASSMGDDFCKGDVAKDIKKMTRAQLMAVVQELQRWREAISDALLGAELGPLQPGTSPVMAIDWLINEHLVVAEREHVEPLTDWQISQLDLNGLQPVAIVRAVEEALGVVQPGEELLRVSVPTAVPEEARAILAGCSAVQHHQDGTDRAQEIWDSLMRAGGAIEPVDLDLQRRRRLRAYVATLPVFDVTTRVGPKIQITTDLFMQEPQ